MNFAKKNIKKSLLPILLVNILIVLLIIIHLHLRLHKILHTIGDTHPLILEFEERVNLPGQVAIEKLFPEIFENIKTFLSKENYDEWMNQ